MALRLIFEVEGGRFRLLRKQRVEMIAPARASPVDPQREGVYAELRDERDEPLYQQVVSTQLDPTVEVFSPDKSVHRVEAPDQKRTIMIVVPDEAEARSIVFLRGRVPAGGRLRAQGVTTPEELARFDISDRDNQ